QSDSTKRSRLSACEDVALQAKSGPRPTRIAGTPGKTRPRVWNPPPESSISAKNSGKKYPTCGPATKSGWPVCDRFAPTRSAFDATAGSAPGGPGGAPRGVGGHPPGPVHGCLRIVRLPRAGEHAASVRRTEAFLERVQEHRVRDLLAAV